MASKKGRVPSTVRRQYTAGEKARAVKDAHKLGVVKAAEKHGIHPSNVSRWKKAADAAGAKGQARRAASSDNGSNKSAGTPRRKTARSSGNGSRADGTASKAGEKRPRRVAKKYTPSQVEEALERAAKKGPTKAAEELGMRRQTIYDWQRKADRASHRDDSASTSSESPEEIEQQRDNEVLSEWKRHPGLGPSQIRNQLRRKGLKISTNTVRRIMEDAGYRPPKVRRSGHDERFEAIRPNHMWHLDYVHQYINRADAHTLILLDDCTRYVTGHGVSDAERADFVIETFEDAIARHGKPEMVLHDKGSAFWSWRGISRFTAFLTELGIDQIVAEHKEWNGKLENFNGNLQKELFKQHRFYDLAEMKRRLQAHLHWYNHARTSHALGGLLVPADRYYGRAEEVLARIEAGLGRDLDDGVDLRNRCLELFKVISRNGAPEVWLMGQRLLKMTE